MCSPWLDSLIVPAYFGAFSAFLFLFQSTKDIFGKSEDSDDETEENKSWFRSKLDIVGGPSIYAFRAVQVVEVLALFVISGVQLVLSLTEGDTASAKSTSRIVQIVQFALLVSDSQFVCMLFPFLPNSYPPSPGVKSKHGYIGV